jgi:hypothetical protein
MSLILWVFIYTGLGDRGHLESQKELQDNDEGSK